jgi:hypothetical protein
MSLSNMPQVQMRSEPLYIPVSRTCEPPRYFSLRANHWLEAAERQKYQRWFYKVWGSFQSKAKLHHLHNDIFWSWRAQCSSLPSVLPAGRQPMSDTSVLGLGEGRRRPDVGQSVLGADHAAGYPKDQNGQDHEDQGTGLVSRPSSILSHHS